LNQSIAEKFRGDGKKAKEEFGERLKMTGDCL
jgi:hypothetical protein